MLAYTVFEYLYRDASNFKAYGSILLRGDFSRDQHNELIQSLEGGEFFIAEQVGMPPLYDLLFQFDGGPTGQDHACTPSTGCAAKRRFHKVSPLGAT